MAFAVLSRLELFAAAVYYRPVSGFDSVEPSSLSRLN